MNTNALSELIASQLIFDEENDTYSVSLSTRQMEEISDSFTELPSYGLTFHFDADGELIDVLDLETEESVDADEVLFLVDLIREQIELI